MRDRETDLRGGGVGAVLGPAEAEAKEKCKQKEQREGGCRGCRSLFSHLSSTNTCHLRALAVFDKVPPAAVGVGAGVIAAIAIGAAVFLALSVVGGKKARIEIPCALHRHFLFLFCCLFSFTNPFA